MGSSERELLQSMETSLRVQLAKKTSELAGVQQAMRDLVERLEAVRRLLVPVEDVPRQAAMKESNGAAFLPFADTPRHPNPTILATFTGKVQEAGTSLRNRIREIMNSHPEGLRPLQVSEIIAKSDFVTMGKTPLTTRVGNELYRMHEIGELEREGGHYRMKFAEAK